MRCKAFNAFKALRLHYALATLLIAVTALADRISKTLILAHSNSKYFEHKLTPFLNLNIVFNKGASFGILGKLNHANIILFTINTLILILLLTILLTSTKPIEVYSYSLLMSGNTGNLTDRALYGYVIDFIDFHISSYHWPSFNIADSCIVIGVALLTGPVLLHNKNKKLKKLAK